MNPKLGWILRFSRPLASRTDGTKHGRHLVSPRTAAAKGLIWPFLLASGRTPAVALLLKSINHLGERDGRDLGG